MKFNFEITKSMTLDDPLFVTIFDKEWEEFLKNGTIIGDQLLTDSDSKLLTDFDALMRFYEKYIYHKEQIKLFKDEQAQQQLANLLSLPLMPPEEVTGSYCHIVKDSVIWIINYLSEQIMILRNHTECEISYRKLESF
ncbi:unnamed protein product [Didymodactylos carnosus]|uniref:Uncharacterized protein n=1 Tax=Didymodactylos carnosus TaxID=1234261 RepID=A0A8S2E972_9BILA|nr:unnamed protein product [Didymodactylos carnosus]CAF3977103.1 unnamed protein product [Didymodactylos carnosus]